MLTQHLFCNNIHDKSPPFKRKPNWIRPASNSPTLVHFFMRIEQELTFINAPCLKTYSNLILQEKTALNNLKNTQSLFIKQCDKGGVFV